MSAATDKQMSFIKTLLEKAMTAFEAAANAETLWGGDAARASFVRGLALLQRVNVPAANLDKDEASEIIDALKSLGGVEFVSALESVLNKLSNRSAFVKIISALQAEPQHAVEPAVPQTLKTYSRVQLSASDTARNSRFAAATARLLDGRANEYARRIVERAKRGEDYAGIVAGMTDIYGDPVANAENLARLQAAVGRFWDGPTSEWPDIIPRHARF